MAGIAVIGHSLPGFIAPVQYSSFSTVWIHYSNWMSDRIGVLRWTVGDDRGPATPPSPDWDKNLRTNSTRKKMSDNWLPVVKGPRRIHQLNADHCLRPLRHRDLSLRFFTTVHQHHISSSFQNPLPPPPPPPSPLPPPLPLPSSRPSLRPRPRLRPPTRKTESSSIAMSTWSWATDLVIRFIDWLSMTQSASHGSAPEGLRRSAYRGNESPPADSETAISYLWILKRINY